MATALPQTDWAEVRRALHVHGVHGWTVLTAASGDTVWLPDGTLLTADVDVVEQLMMERPHTETRPRLYRWAARWFPGADGLLFQTKPLWDAHLKAVMPVFQRAHLSQICDEIQLRARRHAAAWETGDKCSDLYDAVTRMGVEIALRVIFGVDPEHPRGRALGEALVRYKLSTMSTDPFDRLDRLGPTPWTQFRTLLRAPRRLAGFRREFRRVEQELRVLGPKGTGGCTHALRALAENDRRSASWVNHLYGAYNAADYAMAWALVFLQRNPAQRRLLREELRLAPDPLMPGDHEVLPNTTAFLKELFRMAPVANAIYRETGCPLRVGRTTVPTGTQIMVSLAALHYHPRHWREPLRFLPDRWHEERPASSRFAYLPFLTGPRRCWGRPLAELQVASVLRALLPQWDLEVLDPQVAPTAHIIPRFDRAVRFRVRSCTDHPGRETGNDGGRSVPRSR